MVKDEEVYRIVERSTNKHQGVYSRGCHDEYDFRSSEAARHANCHGTYKDSDTYKINKYRVVYELIQEDVDGNR